MPILRVLRTYTRVRKVSAQAVGCPKVTRTDRLALVVSKARSPLGRCCSSLFARFARQYSLPRSELVDLLVAADAHIQPACPDLFEQVLSFSVVFVVGALGLLLVELRCSSLHG